MAGVTVNSGPVEASRYARDVPPDQWPELVSKRHWFSQVKLTYDCRQLVMFIREADELWEPLGYKSADDLIKSGYGLDPQEIRIVSEWLELNDPKEAVKLSDAVKRASAMRDQIEEIKAANPKATQAEIAAEIGVSQQRVSQVTSGTASKGTNKAQVKLSSGTNPTTAAARIRDKLGDEFAVRLADALMS